MQKLTKEEIRNLVDSPKLSTEEIIQVVEEELLIKIDSNLDKDQIVDKVYEAYTEALQTAEKNKPKTKKTVKSVIPTKAYSRKGFIVSKVEEGRYTKAEIIELVSEEFGYSMTGRSPRTRISRVIRELKRANKLEELADGILRTIE
jgi:hypothetical protein